MEFGTTEPLLRTVGDLPPLARLTPLEATRPAGAPSFDFVAPGDYMTEGGEYRLYRRPGLWPPAWNLERGTDLIFADVATKHDAVVLFAHWYEQQSTN